MKNKKSVMAFSGLLILIFHLWVYVSKSNIEMFIKNTAYIGVDIFFFVSAYSLAKREVLDYKRFISSRFSAVYIKYMIFALFQSLYKGYRIQLLVLTVSGLQLLSLWGKAFLWFVPAIMIFYILFPLFQKCDKNNMIFTLVLSISLWLCLSYLGTIFTFGKYSAIVYNRIPVFLLGYYLSKYNVLEKINKNKIIQLVIGLIFTIIGYWMIFLWAYKIKLNTPFVGLYYVVVIPACVGLILLISLIPDVGIIKIIGSCTLEMYAIQMIFGYKIGNIILMHCKNMILNNICIILSVLFISIFVHYVYTYISNCIKNKVKNKNINNIM